MATIYSIKQDKLGELTEDQEINVKIEEYGFGGLGGKRLILHGLSIRLDKEDLYNLMVQILTRV